MPGTYPGSWARQKPPLGTAIDPFHPLARGLAYCHILNDGGGPTAFDLGSYRRNASIASNVVQTVSAGGTDLDSTTGGYLGSAVGHKLQLFSHEALFVPVTVVNQGISSMSGGVGSGEADRGLCIDSGGHFNWYVYPAGNAVGTTTAVAGRPYHVVGTQDATSAIVYVNGRAEGSVASTSAYAGFSTPTLVLGQDLSASKSLTGTDGRLVFHRVWERALAPAEVAALAADPYAMFRGPNTRRFFAISSGGSTSASGAATLGKVAAAGAATLSDPASGASTLGKVSASGAATLVATAAGAATLGKITASGSATLSAPAAGAATLGKVSAAGTATRTDPAAGAATLGKVAASGSATLVATAAGAATLGKVSASGSASPGGTAALLDDTFSGGTVGSSITGRTPSPTANGSDTWTDLSGSGFGTLGYASGGGVHALGYGTQGEAFAGYALTGAGQDQTLTVTFTPASATGFVQIQLRRTADAQGYLALSYDLSTGNLAVVQGVAGSPTTLASVAATLTSGAAHTTRIAAIGTALSVDLDGTTLLADQAITAGTGTNLLVGQSGGTAGDVVFSEVSVAAAATASGAATLGRVSASGSATLSAPASGAATLAKVAASGSATLSAPAAGAATLGKVSASGTATRSDPASGAATLGKVSAAGSATLVATAAGAATLGKVSASGTALAGGSALGAATLAKVSAAGSATLVATAAGAATLGKVSAAGSAATATTAAGAATLGKVAASGSGTLAAPAAGAATLGKVAASGTATTSGGAAVGAATLARIVASGSAGLRANAVGAATLGRVSASGTQAPVFVPSTFEVDFVAYLTAALGQPVYAPLKRGLKFRPPVNVDTTGPIVSYAIINEYREAILSGPTGVVRAQVQVDVFAQLFDDCIATGEAIRRALQGYAGTMGATVVLNCNLHNRTDAWLENEAPKEVGKYRRISEFAVWYRESVPTFTP